MRINVKDTVGQRCIIKEDGQAIYDKIHDEIKKGESVTLDFSDVSQFASPFFNFAIGQLLTDITEVELAKLLHLENLNKTGQVVVERVIENASRYHTNVDYRQIVDAILEQQAKESA